MLKMQESILRADFVQKLLHIVAEMCSYWSRNCRPIILHENPLDTLGSRWLDTILEHITLDHTELEADLAFPSKVCKVHLKWKIEFRKTFLAVILKMNCYLPRGTTMRVASNREEGQTFHESLMPSRSSFCCIYSWYVVILNDCRMIWKKSF